MIFISAGSKYTIGGEPEVNTIQTASGGFATIVTKWDTYVTFSQGEWGAITEQEREFAELRLRFPSLGTELDEITPVQKVQFMGKFDTEIAQQKLGWTDEQRLFVENKLLTNDRHGRDFVRYEPQRTPAPWPNYDRLRVQGRRTLEMVADQIRDQVALLGLDVDSVIAYERENENRALVVEKLEELRFAPVGDSEEIMA